jgi:tetratricopeptide (TPR) repeat protein
MLLASRLSKNLESKLAKASNPIERACVRAEQAILLMRHGHLPEAREVLTELHGQAFQSPNPALGAWLYLSEGLMSYYTDFGSSALEKVLRAHAISRNADMKPMQALSAAWLAHIYFATHEVEAMVRYLAEALSLAESDHHAARSRASLVIAQSYHFADRMAEANLWYARARHHAHAQGDDATLSHLIYNMAALRTAQARRGNVNGQAGGGEHGLLLGADSVQHYDAAVGGSALSELFHILRAQVLVVQGDFKAAQAMFEAHLPQVMTMGLARLGSSLLSDLAWCRVNNGQAEQALQQAQQAEVELDPDCEIDDRALTHARLAQVYAKLGDGAASQRHAQRAEAAWFEFAKEQQLWSQTLDKALQGLAS